MASTPVSDSPKEDILKDISPDQLPRHVAIIMDGNGRWAQRNSLPRIEGHRRGTSTIQQVSRECADLGLEQLTLFCLSNENWKRPDAEVEFLVQLFHQYLVEIRSTLLEENIRLKIVGRREPLPEAVLAEMDKTLEMAQPNDGFCVCLAVNYGARQEIVDACQRIATQVQQGNLAPADIDEKTITENLYTAGMPDPDLLIRTAGEMRISNYLLWQISYSELWVTDRCWPEFRIEDLHQAFFDYAQRQRRFGGLTSG